MATAVVIGGILVFPGISHADPSGPSAPDGSLLLGQQGAVSQPDAVLGSGWRKSSDVLVTGAGDTDGFHLYVAREKDAFAWSTLATLTAPALDMGTWTGEVCLTGSGRYAVAVFAPALAANKPTLLQAGAIAAVVEIRTGKARTVATGVQLAYFNPGCGPDDRVLLTRSIGLDGEQTDLLSVDAPSGTVTGTRRIDAQFTNPTPAPDGDYGIVGGELVKVDRSGSFSRVGTPAGVAFSTHATAGHGIDLASVVNDTVLVQRFDQGSVTDLATGTRGRLQLFSLTGGSSALVGDLTKIGQAPELTRLPSDTRV